MKRRNKGEILKILLDEKASKDNTICLNSYGNGIIDAITFIDKDTDYPQKNCTCNSRTVDEGGNIVHFKECDREKDKLDELIEWIGVEIIWHKGCESDLQVINAYETILITVPTFTFNQGDVYDGAELPIQVSYYNNGDKPFIELVQEDKNINFTSIEQLEKLVKKVKRHHSMAISMLKK